MVLHGRINQRAIAREFKIFDHISVIGQNEDYQAIMNPQHKVTHNLP
jgi:hypothetical protein